MKLKKNSLVLLTIAVLIVFVGAATYAYFTALIDNDASSDITVITHTTDSFIFTMGDDLELEAHQQNFGFNADDLTTSSTSTVQLTASSGDNATYCYTVDLEITSNEFVYTTDGNTPELLFKITKNSTVLVNNLDITTSGGSSFYTFNIPTTSGGSVLKHSISANKTQTTTDTFVATVTFVNLEGSQNLNTGKSFSGGINFTRVECD